MKYSVVIPLKNEAENIAELLQELEPVMQGLQAPFEVICIDDGSTDQTLAILKKLQQKKKYLKTIVFDRNYGQSSAFDAGFKAACGEWVLTLDGDRQNDPNDIPKLIAASSHADLVAGLRLKRQDSPFKKFLSKAANFVRSRICQDKIPDTGCSLKLYRKKCLDQIKLYHGLHRFLPALFLIEGFKVIAVPVNHRPRVKGVTKYNLFNRSFNTISDMWAVYWMRKRQLRYRLKSKA